MTTNRLELEREIVWALMNSGNSFPRFARILKPELFSDGQCQDAIRAMHELSGTGVEINEINVRNTTGDSPFFPESIKTGFANPDIAIKRLTELHILDRKQSLFESLSEEDDAFTVIEGVNRLSNEFAALIAAHSQVPKSVMLSKFIDIIERNKDGHILRVPTGFPTLDDFCHGGLKLGNMSFLGGSGGVGKTSFMLKVGRNAAERGYKTTLIEGEMPEEEILARLHGQFSNLPVHEIENGKHLDRITEFAEHMNFIEYDLHFDFERNVHSLLSAIKAAVHDGSQLILVDYLQVFVDKNGRAQDEFAKIKALSEAIRRLTLINHVHVMAASSLNRLEAGAAKLTLNSFYGGSQLGHDCGTAIIMTEGEDSQPGLDVRTVVCDVVKNRGGKVGPFSIIYNLPTQDMVEQADIRVGQQVALPFNERYGDDEPF